VVSNIDPLLDRDIGGIPLWISLPVKRRY